MASKRRVRRNQCDGKRTFSTSADAISAAIAAERGDLGHLNAYRCKFCGSFHIESDLRQFSFDRIRSDARRRMRVVVRRWHDTSYGHRWAVCDPLLISRRHGECFIGFTRTHAGAIMLANRLISGTVKLNPNLWIRLEVAR